MFKDKILLEDCYSDLRPDQSGHYFDRFIMFILYYHRTGPYNRQPYLLPLEPDSVLFLFRPVYVVVLYPFFPPEDDTPDLSLLL